MKSEMRRGIAVIALVLMFASGSSLFALSLVRRRPPTAGADLIAYQLTIGSTMKRDGKAAELFANDRMGAAAFESRAAETIRQYLRQHGIATEMDSLATKAKVNFMAAFYGHRIEALSCKDVYVFYLTARATEHTPTDEFEETWEWSSLSSASAADLEASLLHELALALQDFLAERPVVPDKKLPDEPGAQPKASSGQKPLASGPRGGGRCAGREPSSGNEDQSGGEQFRAVHGRSSWKQGCGIAADLQSSV